MTQNSLSTCPLSIFLVLNNLKAVGNKLFKGTGRFFVKNNSVFLQNAASYVLKTEVSYPQKAVKEVKA